MRTTYAIYYNKPLVQDVQLQLVDGMSSHDALLTIHMQHVSPIDVVQFSNYKRLLTSIEKADILEHFEYPTPII